MLAVCPISDLRAGSVVVDCGDKLSHPGVWGQTKHRAATESIQVPLRPCYALLDLGMPSRAIVLCASLALCSPSPGLWDEGPVSEIPVHARCHVCS